MAPAEGGVGVCEASVGIKVKEPHTIRPIRQNIQRYHFRLKHPDSNNWVKPRLWTADFIPGYDAGRG